MRVMNCVNNLLSYFGVFRKLYSGVATIFMLHRVSNHDASRLLPNENMKVSPGFLEKFIIGLRKTGYSFVSIDELYDNITRRRKFSKLIVMTFDDGYVDNYINAFPILKYYRVPFIVYIISSFPEQKSKIWWYAIEDILLQNNQIFFNNRCFSCHTREEKIEIFLLLRRYLVNSSINDFDRSLDHLARRYQISWVDKCRELAMSWVQIADISKDALGTIGGHSCSHYVFRNCLESHIIDDITRSTNLISQNINQKVEHFAYPFGSRDEVGRREVEIIKNLGFKTAVTTRTGNIYHKHRFFPHALPRFMLTQNFDTQLLYRLRKQRIVTL